MLWIIVLIILLGWGGGFFVAGLGNIIHILLLVALCIILYNVFVNGRGGRDI